MAVPALCALLAVGACSPGSPSSAVFDPGLGRAITTSAKTRSGVCPEVRCIYVAVSNPAIDIFPLSARGDRSPSAVITGPQTGLTNPQGIAFDALGNTYVANQPASVTVYAPGAQGNASPIADLNGSQTLLNYPTGVAVDAKGFLYVANEFGGSVTVFAPGANGNVSPARTIFGSRTKLNDPWGLALDAKGDLFVGNLSSSNGDPAILEFPPRAHGNVAPIAVIGGAATGLWLVQGVAVDDAGNIYASNQGNLITSISVFAPGSNGNVAPSRQISGFDTGLTVPAGIALDQKGNIYVADWGADTNLSEVLVFAPQANGDTPPARFIGGHRTGFQQSNVGGIVIH